MSASSKSSSQFSAVYKPGEIEAFLDKKHTIPTPGKGEVLLKVAACGVCHSDVTLLNGISPLEKSFTMGHEFCGVPVELGPDVNENAAVKGKLYTVYVINGCISAMSKQPVLFNADGFGLNGGYAQYVVVRAEQLIPVPNGVPRELAAIAGDAGATAYHAVHDTAQVKAGQRVLVFGIGGLGHLALQYARHLGAKVWVCDFKPQARELAEKLGAEHAFDLNELTDKTQSEEGFTVDVTIDFVVNDQTYNLAFNSLKGNSFKAFEPTPRKMVIVGFADENLPYNSLQTLTFNISVLVSVYGTKDSMRTVLDLFAQNKIEGVTHVMPLRDVNKAIDKLRAFEVTGRIVVVPDDDN